MKGSSLFAIRGITHFPLRLTDPEKQKEKERTNENKSRPINADPRCNRGARLVRCSCRRGVSGSPQSASEDHPGRSNQDRSRQSARGKKSSPSKSRRRMASSFGHSTFRCRNPPASLRFRWTPRVVRSSLLRSRRRKTRQKKRPPTRKRKSSELEPPAITTPSAFHSMRTYLSSAKGSI